MCRRHQHFVGYCADVVNTFLVTVQTSKAIVFIEERTEVADVTFPTKPIVLSLRDYDRAEDADQNPVQGYPLVCITVSLRNTCSVLFCSDSGPLRYIHDCTENTRLPTPHLSPRILLLL